MKSPALPLPGGARHEENFPVASWLCPRRLRPAIAAIYWFARTADDIADEGDAPPQVRLAALAAYESDLLACAAGQAASPRWRPVFEPLQAAIRAFDLPTEPLRALLSAFEQDVRKTRDGAGYADRQEVLDYCSRSANPVGRLLLHLYGVTQPQALARSDAICTALQLANFWQDLGVDGLRGRFYLPAQDGAAHGVDPRDASGWATDPGVPALVRELVAWTREVMAQGAPLVHQVPGRAGWELRLVVQGGLRILRRIEAAGYNPVRTRPRLGARDAVPMLWQAIQM